MVRFPKGFVKIKYPGYFWNVDEQQLYSIKVQGTLRPLKLQKAFNRMINGVHVNRPEGYNLSHNGQKAYISFESLTNLVYKHSKLEYVDMADLV